MEECLKCKKLEAEVLWLRSIYPDAPEYVMPTEPTKPKPLTDTVFAKTGSGTVKVGYFDGDGLNIVTTSEVTPQQGEGE